MRSPVSICFDDDFIGEVNRVCFDKDKRIYLEVEKDTGRIINALFYSEGDDIWTEEKARTFLKNRRMNRIYWRKQADGSVLMNTIQLSVSVESSVVKREEAKSIFSQEAFERLSAIEQKYGGDTPPLLKVTPMNFDGKEKTIGNGLEFDRKKTLAMLKDFENLPSHKGHPSPFRDFIDPIGNTVAAREENGNPVAYIYIHPHGEGGSFRETLNIAEAQGQLGNFRISMFGDPIDYDVVKEDDEDYGQIRARINKWKPQSMDFVFEEAVTGSKAMQIVNSKINIDDKKGGLQLDSMRDALDFLGGSKKIMLSDLMSIENIEKIINGHVEIMLTNQKEELLKDESFAKEVISMCSDDVIEGDERIGKIVNSMFKKRAEKLDEDLVNIDKIASKEKVKLSKAQGLMVKSQLDGTQTEAEIKEIIISASKFKNLSEETVGSLFGSEEREKEQGKSRISLGGLGASIEEVEEVSKEEAIDRFTVG